MGYVLGKILPREFMRDLIDNGTVFMKQLAAFPKLGDRVRGDPNEGLYSRYSGENPSLKITITIGDTELKPRIENLIIPASTRTHAVYCMFGLYREPDQRDLTNALNSIRTDPRMREFGDTCAVFLDTQEFVRRLLAAAREAGHELEHGPVEYVSSAHCGPMNAFTKLEDYSYQSEVRFLTARPIDQEHLVLQLGSLLDIAVLIDLQEGEAGGLGHCVTS